MSLQAYLYNADGSDQEIELDEEAVRNLHDRQLLWVDVVGREENEIDRTASLFKLNKQHIKNLFE